MAAAPDHRERLKKALTAIERLQARLAESERGRQREPIAVVGMACRFPGGANGPDAFRTLLRTGGDGIRDVPAERFAMDAWYDPDPDAPGKSYVRRAGLIDGVDRFDPGFFGIAPREALSMDPQHRLLLETAWAALEDAGIVPARLAGARAAVVVGITGSEYAHLLRRAGSRSLDAYHATGCTPAFSAGRLSYVLGLAGPSIAVDTACSSSLVAVHAACAALIAGESDLALAAGVNVMAGPEMFVPMAKARMLSPQGRCATFDAAADGFARGEGCGVVVLKRLSDALAAGDRILAVIRGSAVNQDGATSGMTVPNRAAQEAVIREALAAAGIEPHEVGYVEAHGTGTPLGDPIEIAALAAVLGEDRDPARPLLVGSVKTNFGHLEAAAGIAGFLKAVLAVQHAELHPHLHFREPSRHIPWSQIPVRVPTGLRPWEGRRVAGISSFGASGTNAHVVIEAWAASTREPRAAERPLHVLTASARSEAELDAQIERYASRLAAADPDEVADLCHTANAGRTHFAHRVSVLGSTAAELAERLARAKSAEAGPHVVRGLVRPGTSPRIAFLFSGQGAQHAGMGARLYAGSPVYREAFDRCAEILRPRLGLSLSELVLHGADERLEETALTQPALFALEYSLAELWRSWRIQPAAVLGHSVGEYVAACVAGVLDLEEGLALIAERAALMQALPRAGRMVAVLAPPAVVAAAIERAGGDASIAAINAPENTVVSGPTAAVDAVVAALAADGFESRPLRVSHAFHSSLMEPVLVPLERAALAAGLREPRIPLVSNVTGRVATSEVTDPSYWATHARSTVRFADGVRELAALGCDTFVEIGPHPVLIALARATLTGVEAAWLPSLRRGADDWQELLSSLQRLHVAGAPVDWRAFDEPYGRRRVALPAYPFRGSRYWAEDAGARAQEGVPRPESGHPLLGAELRTASPDRVFEVRLDSASLPWLRDHRIHGGIVLPATALLEMMRAAAANGLGEGPLTLRDVVVSAPLAVPDEGAVDAQVVWQPDGRVSVHSLAGEEWRLHAQGVATAGADTAGEVAGAAGEPVDLEMHYAAFERRGVVFGPAFRALRELVVDGGHAFGQAAGSAAQGGFGMHPAVLDACFQALAPLLPDALLVPVAVERIAVHAPLPDVVRCLASVRAGTPGNAAVADVVVTDPDGRVLVEVEGLALRALQSAGTGTPIHDVTWHAANADGPPAASGSWLLLGGPAEFTAAVGQCLRQAGGSCAIAPAPDMEVGTSLDALLDGLSPDAPRAVVFLAALEHGVGEGPLDETLVQHEHAQRAALGGMLALVKRLAERGMSVRLTVVTRGAQATDPRLERADPLHAAVRGFARVVAAEHAELGVRLVDLDAAAALDADALAAELCASDPDIALRPRGRLAPRLVRRSPGEERMDVPAGPVQLVGDGSATLDGLRLVPQARRAPQAGEVEVRVEAAGLGFRDLLGALGAYPGGAPPLGSDLAGRVERCGEGVDLAPGDRVVGVAEGAFRTFVMVRASSLARLPDDIGLVDAAALPSTFMTAVHALEDVAALEARERVLVHAAAGGVGLAAVQVAQRLGAEVFATVGSDAKRAYLRSIGVRHVYDSRTTAFADEVLADSAGRGVDVVLNSLAGEFIAGSLHALSPHGRFVELGKRNVWSAAEVESIRPHAKYTMLDLGEALLADAGLARRLFARIFEHFATGAYRPLPRQVYALPDAAMAFRAMAESRQIGRLVLVPVRSIHGDASYLVTGGLGGLGGSVLRWLAERGARTIVVTGRHAPGAGARRVLEELDELGVRVVTARADAADPRAMATLLARIDAELPPLAGVLHLAGTNDDGALMRQDWSRVAGVLRPKAAGGLVLVRLLANRPLDFVVHFGSAATLFGARGQAAYAAANAFLEALATWQQHDGRAVTIAWGPWSEAGMAARARVELMGRGVSAMAPERALGALDEVLLRPDCGPFAAILDADWNALAAERALPPALADLATRPAPAVSRPAESSATVRRELDDAAPARRRGLLIAHIRRLAMRVLSLEPDAAPEPDRPLQELGLDSLMAIELRNLLGATLDLAVPLPATAALDHPTIGALADLLMARLYATAARAEPAPTEIEQLSDAEAEAALLAELDDPDVASAAARMVEP